MRIQGRCGGDCSNCELLTSGEVDMIPCALDQVFQRVQRLEEALRELRAELREKKTPRLIETAAVEGE